MKLSSAERRQVMQYLIDMGFITWGVRPIGKEDGLNECMLSCEFIEDLPESIDITITRDDGRKQKLAFSPRKLKDSLSVS
jgi:hypothetical protein